MKSSLDRQQLRLTRYCWKNMLARCTYANHPAWKDYGGRGVKVCDRWNPKAGGSFENFLADMGLKPNGLTLDKDKLGGKIYSPETCCWLTPKEQVQYRRGKKEPGVVYLEHNGITLYARQWEKKLKMRKGTLYDRIVRRGWSVERALTTPTQPKLQFNGKAQTQSEWAQELGIHIGTLSNRLNKLGWSVERALTTPIKARKTSRA